MSVASVTTTEPSMSDKVGEKMKGVTEGLKNFFGSLVEKVKGTLPGSGVEPGSSIVPSTPGTGMGEGMIEKIKENKVVVGIVVVVLLIIIIVLAVVLTKKNNSVGSSDIEYVSGGHVVSDATQQATPDGNVIFLVEPERYVESNKFAISFSIKVDSIDDNNDKNRNILLMPQKRDDTNTSNIVHSYDIKRDENSGMVKSMLNTYSNLPYNKSNSGNGSNYYLHVFLKARTNDIVVRFKHGTKELYNTIVIENINLSKWHTITIIRSGNVVTVHRDGIYVGNSSFDTDTSAGKPGRAHPIFIGSGSRIAGDLTSNTEFYPFRGVISTIIVSPNDSLSATSVPSSDARGKTANDVPAICPPPSK